MPFTKQEVIVIRFLLVTFGLGLAVTAYKEIRRQGAVAQFNQTFAAETREFQRRVREADSLAAITGDEHQFRININTADAATLDRLPGIGPVLAGRIIAYRQANGFFRTVDEITAVRGIGEGKLAKLRDLATVSSSNEGR